MHAVNHSKISFLFKGQLHFGGHQTVKLVGGGISLMFIELGFIYAMYPLSSCLDPYFQIISRVNSQICTLKLLCRKYELQNCTRSYKYVNVWIVHINYFQDLCLLNKNFFPTHGLDIMKVGLGNKNCVPCLCRLVQDFNNPSTSDSKT